MLGARFAEPIAALAAKQVLKGFPGMSEEQPRATSDRVPRPETLVALTAPGEKTELRVLDEAKVVLHIDGVWRVDADLHVRSVKAREAKHRGRQGLLACLIVWTQPSKVSVDNPRRAIEVDRPVLDGSKVGVERIPADGHQIVVGA